ncbi:UDP-N-acetylmuramoyl-L-alanyl-D-glutamate--2,6-diaminopimelate ligase [Candidatus Parcubacteria bacterium]|nr:UDP-N-acetylmuramoyl-L-alanyl-D-glutamate--2,6-diaminopimelate ligase [Candidatus Parcubacteria bacterium]
MRLNELLDKTNYTTNTPIMLLQQAVVLGVVSDSRKVKPGSLFVAVKGLRVDGHKFISQVIEQGAVAVVGEEELDLGDTPYIRVPNSRQVLGQLQAAWYGYPAEKLTVIGVTGTDGKSTTTGLIHSILQEGGLRAGSISTVDAVVGDEILETGLHTTTPEPDVLQKYLAKMVERGLQFAVLEATSHGLDQFRLEGVQFDTAVLTNITPEHLDYHGTFEKYRQAKGLLFKEAKRSVLNADDENVEYFKKGGEVFTYGLKNPADVSGHNWRQTPAGSQLLGRKPLPSRLERTERRRVFCNWTEAPPFTAERTSQFECHAKLPGVSHKFKLISSLLGEFNASNILAAVTTALLYKVEPAAIAAGVRKFKTLPGRMERIVNARGLNIFVDFAHTPNALEQVLKLSAKLRASPAGRRGGDKADSSQLIAVFGCAGERDRQKRPVMGEIAARLADRVVLTAEDPRSEEVDQIIEEIAVGCRRGGAKEGESFFKVPDRQKAINFAIQELAQKGDWVLICGKGHEKSMCYGDTEYPWSDQEAVKKALGRDMY